MADQDEHHMDTDLRSRVVALEQGAQHRESRVTVLEQWKMQRDIAEAKRSEQWKNLDNRFNTLETKIGEVSGTLKWINRMIIAAFIVSLIALVFRNGAPLP